jgi:hypothetical protein
MESDNEIFDEDLKAHLIKENIKKKRDDQKMLF